MGRTLTEILHRDPDVWAALLEVALVALVLIPGSAPWSGPVLLTLTETHGVHLADLVVVVMGLLVLASAVRRGLVRELLVEPAPSGRPRTPALVVR